MITEKELKVLRLKKEGLIQVEIAKKLKISQSAVSSFYKNAIRKIREAQEIYKLKEELKIEV